MLTWNVSAISELTLSVILAGNALVSIQNAIHDIKTLIYVGIYICKPDLYTLISLLLQSITDRSCLLVCLCLYAYVLKWCECAVRMWLSAQELKISDVPKFGGGSIMLHTIPYIRFQVDLFEHLNVALMNEYD